MSFGRYTFYSTPRTYNIDLNTGYSYNNTGSFGYGLGSYGYFGGYTNYNRYGNGLSLFGGYGTALLATSLTNSTNWGTTLYADLDSPSGVSSINPFVDYSINRPYLGGGFTGFSAVSALTGGWCGPYGFNLGMLYC